MSLSRPILPLMASVRPGAASLAVLSARRALHRSTLNTSHTSHARTFLAYPHYCPAAFHRHFLQRRAIHTKPRTSLSRSLSASLSTTRLSSLPHSSTSLSSLPHSTALQPARPYTQFVVLSLVVLSGWFIRRKYLEMRAMRPDLQENPLDPTQPGVQYHEGGFSERMDRAEAALILGVRDGASKEKIMERYRQLMKVNHPDLGGSPYVSTKINEAKELLSKTARSENEGGERRGGKRWQKV